MMGVELYKRGSVYWVAIHANGQRTRKSLKTSERVEAQRARAEIARRLSADETTFFATAPLLRDYADERLEVWKTQLRSTTLPGYKRGIQIAKSVLGDLRLDEITRTHATRLATALMVGPKGPRSAASMRNLLAPIQTLFSNALEDELVTANPFVNRSKLVKRVAPRAPIGEDSEVVPYTRDEQSRLLASIKDLEDRAAVLVALRAGLRRSEVLALRRRDVDFESRLIAVRQRWAGREMDDPKSIRSSREIPMSAELAKILRSVLVKQGERALRHGRPVPVLLFPAKKKMLEATYAQEEGRFGKRFVRYLGAAGVPNTTALPFHRLRHTFASEQLAHGVSIWKVSRWLGHSSIDFTNKIYAHFIPRESDHASFDALDEKSVRPTEVAT